MNIWSAFFFVGVLSHLGCGHSTWVIFRDSVVKLAPEFDAIYLGHCLGEEHVFVPPFLVENKFGGKSPNNEGQRLGLFEKLHGSVRLLQFPLKFLDKTRDILQTILTSFRKSGEIDHTKIWMFFTMD
jgi:hypothetical protein